MTDSVRDEQITVSCPAVSTIGNGDNVLDPTEILTCTASYTITNIDDKNCSVTNIAFASAGGVNSELESVTVYSRTTPCYPDNTDGRLLLGKSANHKTYRAVDDVIAYTYIITNPFKVPVKGPVTVDDKKYLLTQSTARSSTRLGITMSISAERGASHMHCSIYH